MSISLHDMKLCFPESYRARCPGDGGRQLNFTSVRFWDGEWDASCLFIACASQLGQSPPGTPGQLQLIVIEDKPCPPAWLSEDRIPLILVGGESSPIEVYNCVERQISGQRSLASSLTQLLDVLSDSDPNCIIQTISEIIGAPVAMLDDRLRMLIVSDCDVSKHPEFSAALRRGYYHHAGIRPQLSESQPTARSMETGQLSSLEQCRSERLELFCPIDTETKRGLVAGYLYCFFDRRQDALKNQVLLGYICRVLIREFWKDRQFGIPGTSSNIVYILQRILDQSLTDNNVIESLLGQANFAPKKHLKVLVLIPSGAWSKTPGANDSMEHMSGIITNLFPNSVISYYSGGMVVLLQSDERPVVSASQWNLLDEILERNDCYVGTSEAFQRIDNSFKNYYERAISAALAAAALALGPRSSDYNSIALRHLIHNLLVTDTIPTVSKILRFLVDPKLMLLVEQDREHGTDHIKTLRYYWHFNRDTNTICRHLHIHRSTLFYRLNKIKEVLQQDFNKYDNLIQISLGIAILEAIQVIPIERFPQKRENETGST